MKEIIMATNNAHKLEEVRQILGDGFLVKGLAEIGCHEDIPESADTLEGNALQKVRYVHDHYGVDCFADDTGLEVTALEGAPGVFTARFGAMNGYGESHDADANIQCLLDKMEEAEDQDLVTILSLLPQKAKDWHLPRCRLKTRMQSATGEELFLNWLNF